MISSPTAVQPMLVTPSRSHSSGRLPTKHNLRHSRPTTNQFSSSSSGTRSDPNSPQFSRLLGTVLGSPFLITDELPGTEIVDGSVSSVPHGATITRPPSPTPTSDYDAFSMISPPSPTASQVELMYSTPGRAVFSSPPRQMLHSISSQGYVASNGSVYLSPPRGQLKHILPRLWDALSSPARKGKSRSRSTGSDSQDYDEFGELQPLDGEEGELIEDEACFIDARAVTGMDIVSLLPTELSLHLLSYLDLRSILACLAVCSTWRALAGDNSVWRVLFEKNGWVVNLELAQRFGTSNSDKGKGKEGAASIRGSLDEGVTRFGQAIEEWSRRRLNSQEIASHNALEDRIRSRRISRAATAGSGSSRSSLSPVSLNFPSDVIGSATKRLKGPFILNWRMLYKERLELEHRWAHAEPKVTKLSGHTDSVYCIEFDSKRIITGSRDRTIKVWSMKTGKLLATFWGHAGSVLCLKFDQEWDTRADGSDPNDTTSEDDTVGIPGFMVSGSSDSTICVWDLYSTKVAGYDDDVVQVHVRDVIKGHSGGILDLRIDEQWILQGFPGVHLEPSYPELHKTLQGHDGPVNAVGLQDGRIVSASGDGKMLLWDIATGEKIKTFEGHNRGLACIEFKDDLIVSGSNDCNIKLWNASTGECVLTLTGHDLLVRALCYDPRSRRLVSVSYDKTTKVWQLSNEGGKWEGTLVREFRNHHTSHIFDVKFDVGKIVSTSHDHKVIVFDFTQGLDTSLFS